MAGLVGRQGGRCRGALCLSALPHDFIMILQPAARLLVSLNLSEDCAPVCEWTCSSGLLGLSIPSTPHTIRGRLRDPNCKQPMPSAPAAALRQQAANAAGSHSQLQPAAPGGCSLAPPMSVNCMTQNAHSFIYQNVLTCVFIVQLLPHPPARCLLCTGNETDFRRGDLMACPIGLHGRYCIAQCGSS